MLNPANGTNSKVDFGKSLARVGSKARIVFITGTDTGVGKTVVGALLLHHLRKAGVRALAMKPFQSGGDADARLLARMQDRELEVDEVSPFQFAEPLAPLIAGRINGRRIRLVTAVKAIRELQSRCERLVVEGVGGVLVPLGKGYSVLDLMKALDCDGIVVARNRLGTINHTLLTVSVLRAAGLSRVRVVLNEFGRSDFSSKWNLMILRQMLGVRRVHAMPNLGAGGATVARLKKSYEKVKKTLAQVSDFDTFTPLFGTPVEARRGEQPADVALRDRTSTGN